MKKFTFMLFLFSSCSAHSPFILSNTTDVSPRSGSSYPAHNGKVMIIKSSLPPEIKYEDLGQIDFGKNWYGNRDGAVQALADQARKMGADAVIEVKSWIQPSGFSWAAPHASGKAIKFKGKVYKNTFTYEEM